MFISTARVISLAKSHGSLYCVARSGQGFGESPRKSRSAETALPDGVPRKKRRKSKSKGQRSLRQPPSPPIPQKQNDVARQIEDYEFEQRLKSIQTKPKAPPDPSSVNADQEPQQGTSFTQPLVIGMSVLLIGILIATMNF